MSYMPNEIKQLNTPMKLLIVDKYEKKNGVSKPIYKNAIDPIIYCNFKTFGGTERTENDRYIIEDTANIVTWFRPDIKSDCLLVRLSDNATFEILNEPEDIDQMHQYLKFKIKRNKGKA
jgi:hypothetical protein